MKPGFLVEKGLAPGDLHFDFGNSPDGLSRVMVKGDADVWVHPYLKLAVLVIVGWYVVLAILKQGLEEVAAVKGAAA